MNTHMDLGRHLPSRMGFALLVLAAHVLAFGLFRLATPAGLEPSAEIPLTWVILPVPSQPAVVPPPVASAPTPGAARTPAVLPKTQEIPGRADLGSRMPAGQAKPNLCGQPSPKGTDPCPALHASLPDAKLPPRQPTEAEKKRAQDLARELAVQNAPMRLPCVAGPMVDPLCLGMQVLHGFKVSSYADMSDTPYSDPRKNTTKSQYWAKAPQDRWRHPPAPGVPSNEYLALAGGGKRK